MRGAGSSAGRAAEEKLIFFLSFLVVVNPSAFHNKSQIINKYNPLMTRLFNSRIGRCCVGFLFAFSSPSHAIVWLEWQSLREGLTPLPRRMLKVPFAIPIPVDIGHTAAELPLPLVPPRKQHPCSRGSPVPWWSCILAAWGSSNKGLQGAGLWLEDNASEGLVTASSQWGQGAGAGGACCLAGCSDLPVPFCSSNP